MTTRHMLFSGAALGGLAAFPAAAAGLTASVEIPRLPVTEYHRPYIAFWIQDSGGAHVADLEVWYDVAQANDEGETWLKDVRQWWRRSGRALDLPADGLSRPTRAPGVHDLAVAADVVQALAPGDYALVVEAAREVGGREMLTLDFTWPPAAADRVTAQGAEELGEVTLTLTP